MVQDATCNCVPKNIRLLISDVDGTLVTPDKLVTERTCKVVGRLHDAGIEFAITSCAPHSA